MAGMPPWSVPAGTVSGLKGLDLSPWFQNEQLNFQRQQAARQAAQAQQAAQMDMQAQKSMQDYREKIDMLELKAAGEQATEARKERVDALALREREGEAERGLKVKELGLRERALDEEVAGRQQAQQGKMDALDFTVKQQDRDREEQTKLVDAKARARAAVAQRSQQVLQQFAGDPEAARDALLQETLASGMEPNDRIATQEAVGEWYREAVQAAKRKAVEAEEANRAKEGELRLKITEKELERKQKQDDFEASAKRAAPLVRQRERLAQSAMNLDTEIRGLTTAVASAPNDFARNQRSNALALAQATRAKLEAEIQKKDAEINARMGLKAGPEDGTSTVDVSPSEWRAAQKDWD